MYSNGQGVAEDKAEGLRWFKLAAAQGDADAQRSIGFMYKSGIVVTQDFAEALRWFKLAAEQGDATAMADIGGMYALGKDPILNIVKSHMWFNLSAAQGRELSAKARDALNKIMTSQEIATAQKLARECQARDFKNCD